MDAYNPILCPQDGVQGKAFRFARNAFANNDEKVEAEYLLREDGSLFGRGCRLFCEKDGLCYSGSEQFTLLARDVESIDGSYLLKRDGALICVYPNGDRTRFRSLSGERPLQIMDHVRAYLHVQPNDFALLKDGSVFGWGPNWRGALGVPGLGENIEVPAFVTNSVAAIRLGSMYQTIALREDGTLWHWSPAHAAYVPTPLGRSCPKETIRMGNGSPFFLDAEGTLRMLTMKEVFPLCQPEWTELAHDVESFAATRFLLTAHKKDGTLVFFIRSGWAEDQIAQLNETLSGIAQFLVFADAGVALDAQGRLWSFEHVFENQKSKISMEKIAFGFARIDSLRHGQIELRGAYLIDHQGQLVKISGVPPRKYTHRSVQKIEFDRPVLHTLDQGRFVVCGDGSVWEKTRSER